MATSQATSRISFKTILFATDFSPSSQAALPYLLSLARSHGSKVIVAHAVPLEPLPGVSPVPPVAQIDREWQEAQEEMQKYRDSYAFAGLLHEFVLEWGNLVHVISDIADHDAVDLVVVGTHGRKGVHKLLAGSFAEQVFREITWPILTVGPGASVASSTNWEPRKILFATEFSGGSLQALPYALALAEEHHTELILLHVVPLVPWEQQAELAGLYQERLRTLVAGSRQPDCKVDFAVHFDLPAPGILGVARDKQADLIVMGAHHTPLPEFESHVPGSTAYEVISAAHCPVLTKRG